MPPRRRRRAVRRPPVSSGDTVSPRKLIDLPNEILAEIASYLQPGSDDGPPDEKDGPPDEKDGPPDEKDGPPDEEDDDGEGLYHDEKEYWKPRKGHTYSSPLMLCSRQLYLLLFCRFYQPQRRTTALCCFVETGTTSLVKFLLDDSIPGTVDIDSGRDPKHNPLTIAAGKGNIEMMNLLIERGAHVNLPPLDLAPTYKEKRFSPLIAAVKSCRYNSVKFLLGHGANINLRIYKDDNWELGQTPLTLAVKGCFVDITRLLLENGADVHVWTLNRHGVRSGKHEVGRTLLSKAVGLGKEAIVDLLLAYGADKDIDALNPLDSRSLLHDIVAYGTNHLLQRFLDKIPLEYRDLHGLTVLQLAVIGDYVTGNLAVVSTLLDAGANINVRIDSDNLRIPFRSTPLHIAVNQHDTAMVKLLIQRGADLGLTDCARHTPLDRAILVRNRRLVALLARTPGSEASVAISARFYTCGLATAPEKDHAALIDALLKEAAYGNSRDPPAETTHFDITGLSLFTPQVNIEQQGVLRPLWERKGGDTYNYNHLRLDPHDSNPLRYGETPSKARITPSLGASLHIYADQYAPDDNGNPAPIDLSRELKALRKRLAEQDNLIRTLKAAIKTPGPIQVPWWSRTCGKDHGVDEPCESRFTIGRIRDDGNVEWTNDSGSVECIERFVDYVHDQGGDEAGDDDDQGEGDGATKQGEDDGAAKQGENDGDAEYDVVVEDVD